MLCFWKEKPRTIMFVIGIIAYYWGYMRAIGVYMGVI